MHAQRLSGVLVAIFCLVAAPALAEGYDYIRGDDIYEDDYNYGLQYDRLSSTSGTALRSSTPANGDGLRAQSQQLQRDTTQPSMVEELKRWKPDLDQNPSLEMDKGLPLSQ